MKIFIKAFVAFLILCFLVLGLVWSVEKSFDLNSYANKAKEELKSKYGIEVSYHDLSYKLGTRLKILADAVLLEGNGFAASINHIEVSVPLFSIFFGKVEVSDIKIYNPRLTLERDSDGVWNVSPFLLALGGIDKKSGSFIKRITALGGQFKIIDDFIPGQSFEYLIKSSTINFSSGGILAPTGLKFAGMLVDGSQSADLQFSFYWKASGEGKSWKDFQLDGSLSLGPLKTAKLRQLFGKDTLRFNGNEIVSTNLRFNGNLLSKLDFAGDFIIDTPSKKAGAKASHKMVELAGSYQGSKLLINELFVKFPEVTIRGSAAIDDIWEEDPYIDLRLDVPFLNVPQLSLILPSTFSEEPLALFVSKNVTEGRFKVVDFRFEGPYTSFLDFERLSSMGKFSGKVEVQDFSVDMKNFRYPIKGINGSFQIDGDTLVFNGVRAKYGKSVLENISGGVENYRNTPMLIVQVEANLNMGEFHKELLANTGSDELSEVLRIVRDPKGKLGFNFNAKIDIEGAELLDFFGDLYLENGGFGHPFFELPVRKLHGKAYIDMDDITIEEIHWLIGETSIETSGKVMNYQNVDYSFDLKFKADGNVAELAKTNFYRFAPFHDMDGKVKSDLRLRGNLDKLDFVMSSDLTNTRYAFKNLFLKPEGVVSTEKIKGRFERYSSLIVDSLEINLGASEFFLSGELFDFPAMDDFNVSFRVKKLMLDDLPDFFTSYKQGDSAGEVKGSLELSRKDGEDNYLFNVEADIETLKLDPLVLAGPAVEFFEPTGVIAGKLTVSGETGKPININGKLKGTDVGFNTLLSKPFSEMNGEITFAGNRVTAHDVPGRMGSSFGRASVDINLVNPPEVYLRIDGDTVYLSDIVNIADPGQEDEKKQSDAEQSEKPESYSEEDSSPHAKWTVDIKSKNGTLERLKYTNLDTLFYFYRGVYDFSYLRCDAYGGKWEADGALDTVGEGNQKFNNKVKISGMNLGDFLKDVMPEFDKMDGTMDVAGNISGNGLSWTRFSKTLNAELDYTVKDGLINKFDGMAQLWSILNVVPLFIERKEKQKGEGLPFNSLKGRFEFKEGVGTTSDTMLEGNVIRVSAVGDADIGNRKLNLRIGVKPFTSIDSVVSKIPIAGKILTGKEKSLVVSYYEVGGTFEDPTAVSIKGESIARGVIGIIRRILEIPAKALSSDKLNKPKDSDSKSEVGKKERQR